MTGQAREEVRVALARRNMNQADLARELGMQRQYVSGLLRGDIGKIPKSWQKILTHLGLKMVVVPDDE